MKSILFLVFVCTLAQVMAKEMKDFNQVLVEEVKKDIENENDHQFKTKESTTRRPASVIENEGSASVPAMRAEEDKVEKNVKQQLGTNKW